VAKDIEQEKPQIGVSPDISPEEPVVGTAADPRSVSLVVLAVLATALVLHVAQEIFIPIVLSILISYALDPAVTVLARLRVHRAIGSALVLIVLVGGIGAGVYGLRDQATQLLDSLPDAARRLRETVQSKSATPAALTKVQQAATEIQKTATAAAAPAQPPGGAARVQVQEPVIRVSDYLWWGSVGLAGFAVQSTVILFLVFFLLASGDLYKRKLVRIAGPSYYEKRLTVEILHDIDRQIEQFLLMQLLACALVGIATWLALFGLGVHQAAIWGIIAGVMRSIPYIGPAAVTACLAVVGFLQFGTLEMAFYVAAVSLFITSVEGMLVLPAMMGKAAKMNQIAIFVGLLVWGWIWGIWGTILAVPMLMVIKTACDHIDGLQAIGELLGEKSP
jgi:predicted PurR-regulated permease PerM